MQRILVPCDFSEQAISSFRMATEFASQSNREIHLLHVVELPVLHDSMLMPTLSFEESLLKELSDKAEEQFKEIKSQFALDVPLITTVTYGNPPMMILDYIEKNQIELVVMGTKGASGLRELLIGSTAEKIVRRSACPVITVRKYTGLKSIRNIVFANSLEDDQERLVAGVKGLQHLLSATVHLVWINTPGNFTADTITMVKLKDFARRYMLANYTLNVFNDSEEETGVINFAHMISGDMIAMGTRGRKGINHILSGSVTEDVVNHVDCPIWTYRQG